MKKIFLSLVFIIGIISVNKLTAQTGVAINTDGTAADGSAILDVKATDKGILISRVALTSSVTTPVTGLLIYQTSGTPGFYYYNGIVITWQLSAYTGSVAISIFTSPGSFLSGFANSATINNASVNSAYTVGGTQQKFSVVSDGDTHWYKIN